MIGRAHALGRSFKKLVSYLKTGKDGRQQQRDRVEWVEFRNLPTRNPDTAACMMAATAGESVSGTREPVYHFSVSCDPGDLVDPFTLRRVADRLIHDLNLGEYQVLIFAHKDRAHPHLHFVVNRVHPERHTLWRTWKDYPRIERSLRAQEQELGLRIVPGWNSVVVQSENGGLRVPTEYETAFQRVYPRSGQGRGSADFLREVTARAAPVLEQSRSWAELERGLAEQGLALRAKGGGFTLTDGTRQVKASEVGRGCSRFHLENRLGSYPDYRARMAVAGIAAALPAPVVHPPVTRPKESAPTQAQAPARAPEPPVQTPPSATSHTQSTGTVGDGTARPRPQFGDAGHGIHDLFSDSPPVETERPGRAVERTPTPQRMGRAFLREVRERAGPVLEQARSWAEVERGLADHGLVLREKGGGFVVTDGEREVKASEVGRAFSRFHLEKRLGQYPNSRAEKAVEGIPLVTPAPAVKPDPATRQPEQLALPLLTPPVREAKPADVRGARRSTPHTPAPSSADGVTPLTPPVARVQRESPTAPAAAPADDAPPQPPELDSVTTRIPEPAVHLSRSRPADSPASVQPPLSAKEPRGPERPPGRTVESLPTRRDRPTSRSPKRIEAPPVTEPARPLSNRERYRIVLGAFKKELAALYRDPRVARRAFDASLAETGADASAHVLAMTPEHFGWLRFGADLRRLPETGRWAALYARWQSEGTRLKARRAASLFRRAVAVEEAEAVLRDERSAFHKVAGGPSFLADRERQADEGERMVARRLREIYDRPTRAREQIEAYRHAHGRAALQRALEESPECFGSLRTEWKRLLGVPLIPDTTKARWRASGLATYLDGALEAIATRPTYQESAQVREAVRMAQARVDTAQRARDALGPTSASDSVREALQVIDVAGRGSADRAGRLDRHVRSMLPSGALPVVRNLMQNLMQTIVQQQERERDQQQRRSLGPDIA